MVAVVVFKPRVKQVETPGFVGFICAQKARRIVELQKLSGKTVPDDFVFQLVADSICDEAGTLLTTKEQVEESIDILTAQELMDEILEFNRVKKDVKEAKADLKNAPKTSPS